jgi:hypothetical protein
MIPANANFLAANAPLAKQPIYRLEIATYGRIFMWIPSIGDQLLEPVQPGEFIWIEKGGIAPLSLSISDLDGGSNLSTLSVTVQDYKGKITADLPGSQLEGKVATLKTGFPGMARSDYVTLFTGVVDSVDGANDNLSYVFNCTDNSQVLAKVIFTVGDSGRPTDSNNLRTLNGHPIDILIDALTTEVGLDPSQINLAKLYGYRNGTYAGAQFTFEIDSPPAAKDFIENEIMKTLGGYHFTNSLGQFDVNFFYPTSVIPVFAGSLIGAWVDGTGQLVANPFLIANGVIKKVPTSAVALQLGVNDSFYTDNAGRWQVSVNGATAVVVQPTAAPWVFTGGINSAYSGTFTSGTAPTSVAVTAGTTITIAMVNYQDNISQGVSIHGAVGQHFRDGIGIPGEISPAGSPGLYASPAVVFKVPVMTLTTDNTLQIPQAATADLTNVISWRFDKDASGSFLAQPVEEYAKSIARFGSVGAGQLYGQTIIESEGMRSGLQGFFLAEFVSRLIFLRYGLKNLTYSGVPHLWTTCVLEPGDIVSVTNRFVPDRQKGVMGITSKLMEVMDRDWDFQTGTVTLKLLDASYLSSFGGYLITPDAQAVWTSATTDQKSTYMFMANDSDQYSDGSAAHVLG